jgi:hypothetical protein
MKMFYLGCDGEVDKVKVYTIGGLLRGDIANNTARCFAFEGEDRLNFLKHTKSIDRNP